MKLSNAVTAIAAAPMLLLLACSNHHHSMMMVDAFSRTSIQKQGIRARSASSSASSSPLLPPLFLWVNDFSKNGPPSTTSTDEELSVEAQVQSCLQTASVPAKVTTTTLQPLTLFHILDMRQTLEDLQNFCTEEGNQTTDECDVERMEDRQTLLLQLDQLVQTPTLELVQATLESFQQDPQTANIKNNEILPLFTQWLQALEEQTNLCSEEGHQTTDACDVTTMEWRSQLVLQLEDTIDQLQTQTLQATQNCLQYQLCDVRALQKTYANLEELEALCTEEGNQTRSFCSIESKQERMEIMEKILHQLELAEGVKLLERDVSFQI